MPILAPHRAMHLAPRALGSRPSFGNSLQGINSRRAATFSQLRMGGNPAIAETAVFELLRSPAKFTEAEAKRLVEKGSAEAGASGQVPIPRCPVPAPACLGLTLRTSGPDHGGDGHHDFDGRAVSFVSTSVRGFFFRH